MKRLISGRQFIFFIMVMQLGLAFIIMPEFYSTQIGRDAWLMNIFSYAVQAIALVSVIILYYKNPEITIKELLTKKIGKIATNIIFAILVIFFGYKLLTSIKSSYGFFSQNIFDKVSYLPYAVPLLIFIFFASFKGLQNVGRFVEVVMPIIIIAVMCFIVLLSFNIDMRYINPVLEDGLDFFGLYHKVLPSSGNLIVLLLMSGKIEKTRKFAFKTIAMSIFSVACLSLCLLFYYATYGDAGRIIFNATGHLAELPIDFFDLGKFEWILVLVISVLGFVKIYLYFYGLTESFNSIYDTKDKIYILNIVVIILCVFVPVFLPTLTQLQEISGNFIYLQLIPVVLFPLLIFILALLEPKTDKKIKYRKSKVNQLDKIIQVNHNSN